MKVGSQDLYIQKELDCEVIKKGAIYILSGCVHTKELDCEVITKRCYILSRCVHKKELNGEVIKRCYVVVLLKLP